MIFQDRITGMLDAHLTNASNRLNEVMKVLTVVATIFGPPTLIAGIWGMNVPLPHFPGGEDAQFWWVVRRHGADDRRHARSPSAASAGFERRSNRRDR